MENKLKNELITEAVAFKYGDKVAVKFRRLPRKWYGEVLRDDGGENPVVIYADHGLFNIAKIDRSRVELVEHAHERMVSF